MIKTTFTSWLFTSTFISHATTILSQFFSDFKHLDDDCYLIHSDCSLNHQINCFAFYCFLFAVWILMENIVFLYSTLLIQLVLHWFCLLRNAHGLFIWTFEGICHSFVLVMDSCICLLTVIYLVISTSTSIFISTSPSLFTSPSPFTLALSFPW